ncbi:oxysterol-binding protein-related protein 10-like [Pollicipes pollicipes]|uniref:oxysterol-binding protein-related protein 10-like n=1 Tax=Pollicipes pollicipes TaxID=41117 RepID=UPI0018854AE9|nr:oxysterol-binding protein-related protein 10-like [Pollicipes pollicipes]
MDMDNSMKQVLEGQLSKYTNVMKGWQYRWFVLNPESGTLSYFMVDEQRSSRARGSIHLAGAVVCPSDEDSHTFSVNSAAGELYRLRASDARQRQQWVDRLRLVIEMFNRVQAESGSSPPHGEPLSLSVSPRQYEAPLSVLSSLHDASAALQQMAARHGHLCTAVRQLPSHASEDVTVTSTDSDLLLLMATSQATLLCLEQCYSILQQQRSAAALPIGAPLPAGDRSSLRLGATRARPEKDFLADVADWFDTNFGTAKTQRKVSHASPPRPAAAPAAAQAAPPPAAPGRTPAAIGRSAGTAGARGAARMGGAGVAGGRTQCGLKMLYSELWSRPDSFVRIAQADSAAERMCRVLEWYVTSLCAGCPRASKPYNPVLGEVFTCSWPLDGGRTRLRFLAEQVSHHPPVSAICATVGCRAQYVNSATVTLTGEAALHLVHRAETYTFNYPAVALRSLLNERWVELGGQVKIACQQTGYSASVTFHTKPLSDEGERHRVTAEVRSQDGRLVSRLQGNWRGQVQLTGPQVS